MPNRIIKDSIIISKKVSSLTDFQFRLWVHMIVFADDYGRGSADPYLLKGMLFPRVKSVSVAQVEKTVDELAELGMIVRYRSDGDEYFYFPNWDKHQSIRAKRSKYPDPQASEIICKQMQSNVTVIQSNTNQSISNPTRKPKDKYGSQNFDQKTIKMEELSNLI